MTVIVPLVNADEKNVRINITFPEEGDIIYYDVVPAYITVRGTVDAPLGIQNVSITNGLTDTYGNVVCGNNLGIHFNISCNILITDHVTITVVDNSGFVFSETRNFTSYAGPPGPGTIWVTGWIIDPEGQPVPDASVIFERMRENNPVVETTKTGADGMYKMKKAIGFYQRVTVKKEGYQSLVREVTFKEYNNELNLTLMPEERPVPGFDFAVAISAVLGCIFLVIFRRNDLI